MLLNSSCKGFANAKHLLPRLLEAGILLVAFWTTSREMLAEAVNFETGFILGELYLSIPLLLGFGSARAL